MNIGIAVKNNYPVDREVRTEKIARTLDDDGDVIIFARNDRDDAARGTIQGKYLDRTEKLEYATIERFSWFVSTRIGSLITAPIPGNPFWVFWLLLSFKKRDIDIVIAPDLRAGPTAVIAGRLLGIPVIVDIRENHVELAKILPADGLVSSVVGHPLVVSALERFTITFADQIWVVTEERIDDISSRVDRERIQVIGNTPLLEEEDETTGNPFVEYESQSFTLCYVGILNDFRGLDDIIDAVAVLRERGIDVRLLVAGEGPHRSSLERRVEQQEIGDAVTFVGWIDREDVQSFIELADVGLVPHDVNAFTNTTIPNKVYNYMSVGVPVLTTAMTPVERLVKKANAGRVIPLDASPEDIADIIDEMRTNESLEAQGSNGREAIQSELNWQREAKRIRKGLNKLNRTSA